MAKVKIGSETSHASRADARLIVDQSALERATEALRARDPALIASLLALGGMPVSRRREPGFEGLAWIVVSQQVSTASAAAIFIRLKTRLVVIDAPTIASADDETLRQCGLSTAKARTLRAIGDAVTAGTLDLGGLSGETAEAAHAALVAIKGIGPWTADVFLLFCLGHPDAWPVGDLALREAARLALGLPERPTEIDLRVIGEAWRPLRGAMAYLLWASYPALRAREKNGVAAGIRSRLTCRLRAGTGLGSGLFKATFHRSTRRETWP